MASERAYHHGPTASDYSGMPELVHCAACGCEVGMLTPARRAEEAVVVDWQREPVLLCASCMRIEVGEEEED
jgi:hypothetical protein